LFERLKEEAIARNTQFNPKRIVSDFEPGLLPVVEQEVSNLLFSTMVEIFYRLLVFGSHPLWMYVPL